jgi:hypothetical protein
MSASLKGENGARRMSNRIPDDAMAHPFPSDAADPNAPLSQN